LVELQIDSIFYQVFLIIRGWVISQTGAGTQNMHLKITGFNMIAGEIAYWEIHQVMWNTIKRRDTYAVADSNKGDRFFG